VAKTDSPTLVYRRRKRLLGVHAAIFAIVNTANLGQWLLLRDSSIDQIDPRAFGTFWPGWLFLTWGVVLGIHGVIVWARKPVVEMDDSVPIGIRTGRAVRSVVFTDIVGSTERAQRMGDSGWKRVVGRHDRLARELAKRSRGTIVKHTGDGQLAVFQAPGDAIRFATRFRGEVGALDLQIRAGIHAGEVDVLRGDVRGIGVHIASRVLSEAEPSEILVSRTVRDLVAGSDVVLADRGTHTLRGLEGEWQLFAVDDAS
jgi:class 3 adenylate cyclase